MFVIPNLVLKNDHERRQTVSLSGFTLREGEIGVVAIDDDRARLAAMRHLAGLSKAHSLGWTVESDEVSDKEPSNEIRIGLIYENAEAQLSGLFNSVSSELLLPLALSGAARSKQELARDYYAAVWGIESIQESSVANISDGQLQRLLHASMLLAQNDVTLVDGALGHIDPVDRTRLMAFLKVHLMGTGRAIVLFSSAVDASCRAFASKVTVATQEKLKACLLPGPAQAAEQTAPGIVVRDLAWSVPGTGEMVFAELSFAVAKGQCGVVSGRNGAGKSTLGYLLSGSEVPTRGAISIGDALACSPIELSVSIRVCPADPDYVLAEESVLSEIVLNRRSALSESDLESLKKLLGLCGQDQAKPFALSRRLRRKVAILQAIAGAAIAAYLDEPTADGSDEDVRQLEQAIAVCASRGLIIICASNDARLLESPVFQIRIQLSEPESADQQNSAPELPPPKGTASVPSNHPADSIALWTSAAKEWVANSGEFCLFWCRFVYPRLAHLLAGQVQLPARARLLDLGCGNGLHTAAFRSLLRRAGCSVQKTIGVDAVDLFIKYAELNSNDSGDLFVCADLVDFRTVELVADYIEKDPGPIIVTAFFSLHDLSSLDALKSLLTRLRKAPGSLFIGVIVSPDFVDRTAQQGQITLHAPDALTRQKSDWDAVADFKVSSDHSNSLAVPYYHRSVQHYVSTLESAWGPTTLLEPGNLDVELLALNGSRSDDLLFLISQPR